MTERPSDLINAATIAAYKEGPPNESSDFDFLLGSWTTKTRRYDSNGSERLSLEGLWTARHLAGGRILLDETISFDREGVEIASMATLRTYSPVTNRWEMTFVSALQPVLPISLTGTRIDHELHLEVRPLDSPDGPVVARLRFFDIGPAHFEWEQHVSIDGEHFGRTVSISADRAWIQEGGSGTA